MVDYNAKDVACTTKRRYASKHQAKKTLKLMHRRGRRGLVIYQCWHCELYHLGYPPGQQTYRRSGAIYG